MTPVTLRKLSRADRERAFASTKATIDYRPYEAAVREMEGGEAYAIPLNGVSGRSTRVRLGRAAKRLGLDLHWAKTAKGASELIVELK